MATAHVVGAGLAGLAAAVRLARAGRPVILYEGAQQAGGRCRSYFDRTLDCTIDNGNHLLLSGNRSALGYLEAIGARDTLAGPEEAVFPFVDLETGARWAVRPNPGRLPWWILVPSRRVPGTRAWSYLGAWRLARAPAEATIADCLETTGTLWRCFWDPLARAVLNTPPEAGSARLLWAALAESFGQGGRGCRPLIARDGLSASFVDPAVATLEEAGVPLRYGHRLRRIERDEKRIEALDFDAGRVDLGPDDVVILALPPSQAGALLAGLGVPAGSHAIVNAHFRLQDPVRLPGNSVLLGVIGGTAEWIFARGALISITVSAADRFAEVPAEVLARALWTDTARALELDVEPEPPGRVVKERRATFAQTPSAATDRPPPRTAWTNLLLAGDWTATGLPATIEGAIRSGDTAAELAVNDL